MKVDKPKVGKQYLVLSNVTGHDLKIGSIVSCISITEEINVDGSPIYLSLFSSNDGRQGYMEPEEYKSYRVIDSIFGNASNVETEEELIDLYCKETGDTKHKLLGRNFYSSECTQWLINKYLTAIKLERSR